MARFILLAKKLQLKLFIFSVNNSSIDSLLRRVMELEQENKIVKKNKVNFIKVASHKTENHPDIAPFANDCNSFDSLRQLHLIIEKTDIVCATVGGIFN